MQLRTTDGHQYGQLLPCFGGLPAPIYFRFFCLEPLSPFHNHVLKFLNYLNYLCHYLKFLHYLLVTSSYPNGERFEFTWQLAPNFFISFLASAFQLFKKSNTFLSLKPYHNYIFCKVKRQLTHT